MKIIEIELKNYYWKRNIQSDSRSKLIEVMKSWGGVVIDVPYTKGISSTELNSKF